MNILFFLSLFYSSFSLLFNFGNFCCHILKLRDCSSALSSLLRSRSKAFYSSVTVSLISSISFLFFFRLSIPLLILSIFLAWHLLFLLNPQHQFSSVQSLSHVQLFVTPWIAARQASLSITNSRSLFKLMSIESVMPSNHLILCHPLLLPLIFPSIRVFSNESALCISILIIILKNPKLLILTFMPYRTPVCSASSNCFLSFSVPCSYLLQGRYDVLGKRNYGK